MISRLRLGERRFTFRPIMTAFVLVSLVILVSLGRWQLDRLDWKEGLIGAVEARKGAAPIALSSAMKAADAGDFMDYTPVELTGVISGLGVNVFGAHQGTPGLFIFCPFELSDGALPDYDVVYVNMGFAPQRAGEWSHPCQEQSPTLDRTTITGVFRAKENLRPPAAWLTPTAPVDGVWHIRDPQKFGEGSTLRIAPFYVDRFDETNGAIPTGGLTRIEFSNNHLDYALTWFGLALTLCAVWGVLSFPIDKK